MISNGQSDKNIKNENEKLAGSGYIVEQARENIYRLDKNNHTDQSIAICLLKVPCPFVWFPVHLTGSLILSSMLAYYIGNAFNLYINNIINLVMQSIEALHLIHSFISASVRSRRRGGKSDVHRCRGNIQATKTLTDS